MKPNDLDLLLHSSSSGHFGLIVRPMRSFQQQPVAYCVVVRNTFEQESLVLLALMELSLQI